MKEKVATDSIQLFQYDFWSISDFVFEFREFKEPFGDVAESVVSRRETESENSGQLKEMGGGKLVVSVKVGESKIIGRLVESLTSEKEHDSENFFDVLSPTSEMVFWVFRLSEDAWIS